MKPVGLQNEFTAGMKRDFPRNRMPPNSAWTLKDVILDYGAPARERGGWAHASNSITAVTAGADSVVAGIYVVFSTTGGSVPKNIAMSLDVGVATRLIDVTNPAAAASIGAGGAIGVEQNPVFHGGTAASAATAVYTGLVIIPYHPDVAVYVYDGTTLTTLHGSPPKTYFATVYKDYTVLGHGKVGTTLFPNRVWFSPPGDPDCFGTSGVTAWDTTDAWIDFSTPVRGLASTKNVMLVFGDGQVSRVRGSVPPPDTDMTVDDPWMKVGLLDPFSITTNEDIVYWCAPEGIFRSDGVYLDNLTAKGGMLRYWLDLMASATTAYQFSTGIIRNQLVVSVLNGTTPVDAFMIDLQSYAWTQIGNLPAQCFWDGVLQGVVADDTFFGRSTAPYVGRLDTMFSGVSSSTYKADADGTAVAAVIETPFYDLGRPGIKTIKGLHFGYVLTDHGSDNPTAAVSYIATPEETSYTSVGSLAETTAYDRRRLQLGGRFWGLGLKFTRASAGDFMLFDLSAEVAYQEESKRKS